MATSFKGPMHALLPSVPPALQLATANPCLRQRLLDTPGHVWVGPLAWMQLWKGVPLQCRQPC